MKDFFTMKMLTLAATFVIGPLTYLAVQHIKRFWLWLGRQNANVIRAFVLVIAFALTAAAQSAGVALPSECADVGTGALTTECQSALANPVWVKTVMSALVAFAMHYLKKASPSE